jgi:VanZ family protein
MKLSDRTSNWLIIGYLTLVVYFSTAILNASLKLNRVKVLSVRLDFLLHVLMFIPWMILAHCRWGHREDNRAVFWLTLGLGVGLTGFSEALQYLIPFRSVSKMDLVANLTGLALGAFISLGWKNKFSRNSGFARPGTPHSVDSRLQNEGRN